MNTRSQMNVHIPIKGISSTVSPEQFKAISSMNFDHPFISDVVTLEQVQTLIDQLLIMADGMSMHPAVISHKISEILDGLKSPRLGITRNQLGVCEICNILPIDIHTGQMIGQPIYTYNVYAQDIIGSDIKRYVYNKTPQISLTDIMPGTPMRQNPSGFDMSSGNPFKPINISPMNHPVFGNQAMNMPQTITNPIQLNPQPAFGVTATTPSLPEHMQMIISVLQEINGKLSINKQTSSKDGFPMQPLQANMGNIHQMANSMESQHSMIPTPANPFHNLELPFRDLYSLLTNISTSPINIDGLLNYINMIILEDEVATASITQLIHTTGLKDYLNMLSLDQVYNVLDYILTRGFNPFSMVFTQALRDIKFTNFSIHYKSTSNSDERCIIKSRLDKEERVIYFKNSEKVDEPSVNTTKANHPISVEAYAEVAEHYYHIPEPILNSLLSASGISLDLIKDYKGLPIDLSYDGLLYSYRHTSGSNPELVSDDFFDNHKDEFTGILHNGRNEVLDTMTKLIENEDQDK